MEWTDAKAEFAQSVKNIRRRLSYRYPTEIYYTDLNRN